MAGRLAPVKAGSRCVSTAGASSLRSPASVLPRPHRCTVVDELIEVTSLPAGRGTSFDPATVCIEWKGSRSRDHIVNARRLAPHPGALGSDPPQGLLPLGVLTLPVGGF